MSDENVKSEERISEAMSDVPLTESARRSLAKFNQNVAEYSRRAEEIALVILVWGPNPKATSAVALKRVQIRDELRRIGHAAVFSENLLIHNSDLSLKSVEFDQAINADLIVILMDSPGAIGEAHDFCNHEKIAPKIWVMIPEEYREGYSGWGALRDLEDAHRGVYWYKKDEITTCNVLTEVMKCAEARRRMRFRSKNEWQ